MIGWAKTIQICHIIRPPKPTQEVAVWSSNISSNDDAESVISSSSTVALSGQLGAYVQITMQIELTQSNQSDPLICGIATHQNGILVLVYPSRTIESLLVAENEVQERPPQLVVYDVADALLSPAYPPGDLDSILSAEEDKFEEISREDVDLKMPPGRGFQGLGLGKFTRE